MTFFDVEDGEGGSIEDRIAIIAVVAFAFSWIPIFLIWKCITVVRRKSDNTNGNLPVTTHSSDPEKHPYHPEAEPTKSTLPTSREDHRQPSRDAGRRAPGDVERRSSRGDQRRKGAKKAIETPSNRRDFDSAKAYHLKHAGEEQHSSSKRHPERQGSRSSKRVQDVADAPVPSRHRSSQRHDERVRKQHNGFQDVPF